MDRSAAERRPAFPQMFNAAASSSVALPPLDPLHAAPRAPIGLDSPASTSSEPVKVCRPASAQRKGSERWFRAGQAPLLLAICLHGGTFGVPCNAVTSGNNGVEGGT